MSYLCKNLIAPSINRFKKEVVSSDSIENVKYRVTSRMPIIFD